jgi:hypothetical protein
MPVHVRDKGVSQFFFPDLPVSCTTSLAPVLIKKLPRTGKYADGIFQISGYFGFVKPLVS